MSADPVRPPDGFRRPVQYQFDEEKATEATALLLHLSGGSEYYLKIMKLLYRADRESISQRGSPIAGDHYVAMDWGPVLSTVYDLIKGRAFFESLHWEQMIETRDYRIALKAPDGFRPRLLSRWEVETLTRIWKQFKDADRFEHAMQTHADFPEWTDPKGSSHTIYLEEILEKLNKKPEEAEGILQLALERNSIQDLNCRQ